MAPKSTAVEISAICGVFILLALWGIVWDITSGLLTSGIDGIMLLFVCAMMAGIFFLIMLMELAKSGIVPTPAFLRPAPKPAAAAKAPAAATPAAKAPAAGTPAATPKPSVPAAGTSGAVAPKPTSPTAETRAQQREPLRWNRPRLRSPRSSGVGRCVHFMVLIPLREFPAINAGLNGASAIFLLLGYIFIRSRRILQHKICMLSAFACSIVFLCCYLYFHFHAGLIRFGGEGWIRPVYFALLISHTILAVTIVPLAVITLSYALREKFGSHMKIARWTFPLWLYVSITGVIIYWLLYIAYTPIGAPA